MFSLTLELLCTPKLFTILVLKKPMWLSGKPARHRKSLRSSTVEQRYRKPQVAGSNPAVGSVQTGGAMLS
jgi:hypothetical protein